MRKAQPRVILLGNSGQILVSLEFLTGLKEQDPEKGLTLLCIAGLKAV